MDRKKALKIWTIQFGDKEEVEDFAGRRINRANYGTKGKKSWNLDHIKPKSKGGKNSDDNIIICHIETNREKNDSFPHFKANGKKFNIQKSGKGYIIVESKQNKISPSKDKDVQEKLENKQNSIKDILEKKIQKSSNNIKARKKREKPLFQREADSLIDRCYNYMNEEYEHDNSYYVDFLQVRIRVYDAEDVGVLDFIEYMLKELFNVGSIYRIPLKQRYYLGNAELGYGVNIYNQSQLEREIRSFGYKDYCLVVRKDDIYEISESKKFLDNTIIFNTYAQDYIERYFDCDIRTLASELSYDSIREANNAFDDCMRRYIDNSTYEERVHYINKRIFTHMPFDRLSYLAINEEFAQNIDLNLDENNEYLDENYIEYDYIKPNLEKYLQSK